MFTFTLPNDLGLQIGQVEIETVGNRLQVVHLEILASQEQSGRYVIVDNNAAIAIENASAGSQQGAGFDAILLGSFLVVFGVLHLQSPETGNQEQKDHHRGVLEDSDFAGRKMRIVVQLRLRENIRIGISIGRRNNHCERDPSSLPILAGHVVWQAILPAGGLSARLLSFAYSHIARG